MGQMDKFSMTSSQEQRDLNNSTNNENRPFVWLQSTSDLRLELTKLELSFLRAAGTHEPSPSAWAAVSVVAGGAEGERSHCPSPQAPVPCNATDSPVEKIWCHFQITHFFPRSLNSSLKIE